MTFLRYIDLALVVFALPLVIAAGAPLTGYAIGAAGWFAARGGGELMERRAKTMEPRSGIGMLVAAMMGRAWVVAVAAIVARAVGGRDDGLTAVLLALAAFTVYFAMSIAMRQSQRSVPRS